MRSLVGARITTEDFGLQPRSMTGSASDRGPSDLGSRPTYPEKRGDAKIESLGEAWYLYQLRTVLLRF